MKQWFRNVVAKMPAANRPLAVAIVLAILLTCLPMSVFGSAYADELIVDGGFDTGLIEWAASGTVSGESGYAQLSGADGQVILQSQSSEAAAESDYTLSFDVRLSADAVFAAQIAQLAADSTSEAGELSVPLAESVRSGEWETVSYTFRSAADVTELGVYFELTAGTADVDNVSLKRTHDTPVYSVAGEAVTLKNAGFADRLTGWTAAGEASVTTGWFGKAAALAPQGGKATLTQDGLVLESGAVYELHYYIKATAAADCSSGVSVVLTDNGTARTVMPYVQTGNTAGGWQEVTMQFETGAVSGTAALVLTADGGSAETLIVFDEITLTQLDSGTPLLFALSASDNLIDVSTATNVPKGTTYTATTDGFSFVNGTAAKVTGASWTHNIAWEAGKTYVVSYKAKTSATVSGLIAYPEMQVGGVLYNHGKNTTEIGKIMADAGVRIGAALADWTAYTYEFTVPEDSSATAANYLRFVVTLGAGDSIEYKELSVTVKEETEEDSPTSENLYTNGEFAVDSTYLNVTDFTMSQAFPDGNLAWGNNNNAKNNADYKVVTDPEVGNAFYVQGTSAAKSQNLLQHKIPWEAGETYVIRFKYKTTADATSANLDFYGQVTAGVTGTTASQRIGDRVQKAVTAWTSVSQEWTAPTDLTGSNNYFRFIVSLAADAGVYIADVSVVKKVVVTPTLPPHWLDNGNFTLGDDGTQDWNGITAADLIDGTAAGAESGKALVITAAANTDVYHSAFTKALEVGKMYTLTFRARNDAPSASDLGSVYFTKQDGSGKLAELKLIATNGVWEYYAVDFTVSAGYEYPRLRLDLTAGVTYIFADFAFGEYEEYLANGTFANDLESWTVSTAAGNNAVVSVVTDPTHGKALQVVKPREDTTFTDIVHAATAKKLLLGKTYTVSYYFKMDATNETDGRHYPMYRKSNNSGSIIPSYRIEEAANGWQKISYDFTVTSDAYTMPRICVRAINRNSSSLAQTTYWFANMSIEETTDVAKGAVGVQNGDFSQTTGTYPQFWGATGTQNVVVTDGALTVTAGASVMGVVYGNTKHVLTFKFKGDAVAREGFAMQLMAYKDAARTLIGDQAIAAPVVTLADTDDWQTVELAFTTPDGAEYADLSFIAYTGSYQIDDVVLALDGEAQLNFDFELGEQTPISWSYSGQGVFTRAKESDDGSYAAKVTNGVSGRLVSSTFDLEAGGYYELSFRLKADMAFDASVYPVVVQRTADGTGAHSITYSGTSENYRTTTGSINFPWTFRVYGSTDGWHFVRAYFCAAEDAATGYLQFSLSGASTEVLIDHVRLAQYDNTVSNMDFETVDEDGRLAGWYLGDARDTKAVFEQDTTMYHSGKASAHLKLDSLLKETFLINSYQIPVTAADSTRVFEFSFWVASRDADVKSVQLNLWYYDAAGVKLYTEGVSQLTANIVGTVKTLNGSSEISEWSKVITRVQIPEKVNGEKVASVGMVFTLTYGEGEIWLDDLFFDQVEDDTAIVVEHNDFHAVDQDGNLAGWTAENGTLVQKIDDEKGFAYGHLVNGTMNYRVTTLATDYQYALVVRYRSDYAVGLNMTFSNYQGQEYPEAAKTYTLAASADWREEEIRFTAPSATVTNLAFGLDKADAALDVSRLVIYQTGKPDTEMGWTGKWIGYSATSRNADEYDMSYYRYTFTLEEEVVYAPFQITGDDNYTLYVNGTEVFTNLEGGLDIWSNVTVLDLVDYLKVGENIIAVQLYNHGAYSALVFDGIWELASGAAFECVSGEDVRCLNPDPTGDWTAYDYDDSDWDNVVVYGSVPLTPWGSIYFDASLYIDNLIDVRVNEGEGVLVNDLEYEFSIDIKLTNPIAAQLPFSMVLWRKNSTDSMCNLAPEFLENGDMTQWPVDKWFTVRMKVELPDYISDGNYSLQLSDTYFLIDNDEIFENKFISFKVVNDYEAAEAESSVEMINGSPTLVVNGEAVPAFLFHNNTFDRTTALDTISESGIETYIGVTTRIMAYNDKADLWNENGSYNFECLDTNINDLLNASSTANIIVTIGMWAPSWWIEQNPDECVVSVDADGVETQHVYASFGSEKWKQDGGMIIKAIVEHMREQDYYSRVIGIRLTGGRTSEFMTYGTDSLGDVADYSPAARNFYRSWLQQKYGTVEAIREAYNDPTIASFETIEMPDYLQLQEASEWGELYDPELQQKYIDFRLLLDEMTIDQLLYWAQCVKEATDNKLIVGAYYGYMFIGSSYSGIGTMHTSFQKVMNSPYLDFFCSPSGYNEKQLGESSYVQTAADSIQAYGKLCITEQDNRTVLTSQFAGSVWDTPRDYSIGTTHTMEHTMLQEKRDVVANIVAGNGEWLFDMQGGWLDDDQIYAFTNDVNDEYNFYNYIDKDLTNDVAVIIPDTYPAYYRTTGLSTTVVSNYMYQWHRKILAKIGTGYDVYAMSTLVEGKMPKHKVNIFFTPYMLTAAERKAIDTYCKCDGQVNIFLYKSGLGDEEGYDLANMTELTGFTFGMNDQTAVGQITITNENTKITAGLAGETFGLMVSSSNYLEQEFYVDVTNDSEAVVLGVNSDTGNPGFVMKEMDGWTSVYTTTAHLPVGAYRNILKMVRSHIYSDDLSDIVWSNSSYVGVTSANSGQKTIKLPDNYAVYDVFEEKVVSLDTNVITYTNAENDTHLFRLTPVNTYSFLTMVKGGNGTVSSTGLEYLAPGSAKTLTFTPAEGYMVKSVTVNGKETELAANNTLTFTDIDENITVVVRYKRLPCTRTLEEEEEPPTEPPVADTPAVDTPLPEEEQPIELPEDKPADAPYEEEWGTWEWRIDFTAWQVVLMWTGVLLLVLLILWLKRRKKKEEEAKK